MSSLMSKRLDNRRDCHENHQAEQLKTGLERFQNIMTIRDKLNRRIGRRLTFLTRFTMISLASLVIAFILLISVMSAKVADISYSVYAIEKNYASVLNNISTMNDDFSQVHANLQSFDDMSGVLSQIDRQTAILTANMGKLDHNLASVTKSMYGMQATATEIDQSFYKMEGSVYQLQFDVGKSAKPVRFFNKMMGR